MNDQPEKERVLECERRVEHDEQGSYLELPFDLPEDAVRLHVSYSYESLGAGRGVIDLGLCDGKRVHGWSGGARSEFVIEADSATPGYLSGELEAGCWAVLLGAYRVPPEGCIVRVTISMTLASGVWLKGDLHSHTEHSDGTYTLEEAVEIMRGAGCDFLATTDHNTVSQNYAHPRESGLVLIPGMELTTYFGHSNLLGTMEPIRDFRVSGRGDVLDRLQEAKENGALRIINHPLCDHCPWEWGMEVEADAVEIWNGPWRSLNERALEWWQEQLAGGRRIVAVGGSDVHRPHPYVKHASPTTWVYAQARNGRDILKGISAGHVYMSFAPYGPQLELRCGEYGIGDIVPSGETNAVSVRLERLAEGDMIRFITEKGTVCEWQISDYTDVWEHAWEAKDVHFMRVEVRRHFQEAGGFVPALISNPIYFRS